jgi:hypothetical protein
MAARGPRLVATRLTSRCAAAKDPQALLQALRDEPDFRGRLIAVLGVRNRTEAATVGARLGLVADPAPPTR